MKMPTMPLSFRAQSKLHTMTADLDREAMHFNALWWSAGDQSPRANKTLGDDPLRVVNSSWTRSTTIAYHSKTGDENARLQNTVIKSL